MERQIIDGLLVEKASFPACDYPAFSGCACQIVHEGQAFCALRDDHPGTVGCPGDSEPPESEYTDEDGNLVGGE